MFRNIDFFAVCVIALGLMALSKVPAIAFPRVPAVRFQQAVTADECPTTSVLSRLSALFER